MDRRYSFDLVHPTLDVVSAQAEAARCLYCNDVCNVCVSVCPNRANVSFTTQPMTIKSQIARRENGQIIVEDVGTIQITQSPQILNLADFCNECGNCTTFCPTNGDPYRTKPHFHLTDAGFEAESTGYMFKDNVLKAKFDCDEAKMWSENGSVIYETDEVRAEFNADTFQSKTVVFKSEDVDQISFDQAAEMFVLWRSLEGFYLFG